MTILRRMTLALAILVTGLTAAPASAAPPQSTPRTVFGGYWSEFIEHWGGAVKKQNGVVMVAIGVGIVGLFIITRGKWVK